MTRRVLTYILFIILTKLFIVVKLNAHPIEVHKRLIEQGDSILGIDKGVDILKPFIGEERKKMLKDMADKDREGEGGRPDNDGVMWPDVVGTTTPGHPFGIVDEIFNKEALWVGLFQY